MPKNIVFQKMRIHHSSIMINYLMMVTSKGLFFFSKMRYDMIQLLLLNFAFASIILIDMICIDVYFLINISVMGCCVTTSQGRKTESSVLQERKVNIERRSSLNLAHKKHYVTFYCQVCNRPFNQISRFPYTICVNTHIACSHCGNSFYNNKVKNCPFCS